MTDKQIRDKILGALSVSMMPMEQESECIRFLNQCLEERKAMDRLGRFGRLFRDYKGCPRGSRGPLGELHETHILLQERPVTDVEGDMWIPVYATDLYAYILEHENNPGIIADQLQQLNDWQLSQLTYSLGDAPFCKGEKAKECALLLDQDIEIEEKKCMECVRVWLQEVEV